MTKTSVKTKKEWLQKAQTLAEALPYMREFSGETFVIKYGGHAMGDRELSEKIAQPFPLPLDAWSKFLSAI